MKDIIDNYFLTIFSVFVIWNALIIIASIIYRRYKKAGEKPFDDSTLIFNESWASGSSRKNWYTRIGGASRCLTVSVNEAEVYIRPFFFLRFGFLSEILDLEHRIPKENVISVKPSKDLFGSKTTEVRFSTASGQQRSFDLYLDKEDSFFHLFSDSCSEAALKADVKKF